MESYFKLSKFESAFEAITDSLKNGQKFYKKIDVSKIKTEEVIPQLRPFLINNLTLYDIGVIRQDVEITIKREDLIDRMNNSTDELKEFYHLR